ncbi:hypothetical protein L8R84_28510 [Vibrio splendidus]|uniref:hypothetical protein n=1 Tax=Vibrio splendidus TaxID=29497 RepID=UPI0024689573|nr:hypothetical protein [Vibrio splendidus]MDH5939990.1 hypothetical protein [Vibrio splendidus]
MKRTLKIMVITGAILWGTLLSSALAQVARYIESQYALDERVIHQAVQDCVPPPAIKIEEESGSLPSSIKRSPYTCLQQKGHPELAHRLRLNDEAMQSVSWPLSLFW